MGSLPNDTRDNGPAWVSRYGVSGACVVSADATGNPAVTDAPPTGFYLVVDDIIFSIDTATNLTFSEETSGTVIFKVYTAANTTGQLTPRGKVRLATAAKRLMMDAAASGNVACLVTYHFESGKP